MQKKRLGGNSILDKLHRGAVYTCIGITLYGTYLLGQRAYNFYTVVRPEREKAEKQMISEGAHDNAKELKY